MSEMERAVPGRSLSGAARAWTSLGARVSGAAAGLRRMAQRLYGIHGLALADQAVVSAASFFTTVIIGRCTDPSQLGVYAIAITVLASLFTIQGSLITLPYSIQRHRPLGTPQEHAGSALAQTGLMLGLVVAGLAGAAVALLARGASSEVVAMTWALAAVAPFALLREFCRRFSFAHFHLGHALALDSAVSVVQVATLAWLGWTGHMSAVTACAALGLSCAVAAFGWFWVARGEFAIRHDQVGPSVRQGWSLGKWLFINQIMVQLQRYATHWLSLVIAGAAVTGVYAACLSIVAFANPVTFGLGNMLAPRSALAWKERGGAGLRRQALGDALLFAGILAPFCLLAFFAAEDLMRLLYHGHEYEGHGSVVTLLALAALASSVGTPASNALASMERPRAIFCVGAAAAVLTVTLVWWWMVEWGLVGGACGLLAGSMVGSAGLWASFLALVPRTGDAAPALDAIEAFTKDFDSRRTAVTRLGEGDYATVYRIDSKDDEPIWQDRHHVVIKAYKPDAGLSVATVQAEFDSLFRLHDALHGRDVEGWTIATPLPLRVCESPLALAMTPVAARKDLKSSPASDAELTPNCLEQLGRVLVGAMQTIWSRGQFHGDLGLQNVLYDVDSRTLALIDPGTPVCCRVCHQGARDWRPAALELGHILRDLGTDVRDVIGDPIARLRRQVFVESALLTYLETIGQPDERRRALDEIRASAHTHLWQVLEPSLSPRGMWHWLLAQVVIWRMDSMLDWIEGEATLMRRRHENMHLAKCAQMQRAQA